MTIQQIIGLAFLIYGILYACWWIPKTLQLRKERRGNRMTEKRFTLHKGLDTINIMDNTKFREQIYINKSSKDMKCLVGLLNELAEENQQLKEALLFFVDVANSEYSSNWQEDMEKDCQKLFNCSYKEAQEKYDNYDSSWWELE